MNPTSGLEELSAVLNAMRPLAERIAYLGRLVRQAIRDGHKVMTVGNGGSAADALHLAEELVGRYHRPRPPMPAICLCADTTALTCIANDFGFEHVFARQVEALGAAGDILVVFSTSGRSPSVIEAIAVARRRRVVTLGLLGKDGGVASTMVDEALIVPSSNTARIQEVHTFVLHCWLEMLEADPVG